MDEYILVHHGVLGMKWGVRKDRRSPSTNKVKKDTNKYRENKKLNKKVNAKSATKKGAAYVSSLLAGLKSVKFSDILESQEFWSISNSAARAIVIGIVGGNPALSLVSLGFSVTSAAVGAKTKNKVSGKDRTKIKTVEKYKR